MRPPGSAISLSDAGAGGSDRIALLAVDTVSLPLRKGLCYYLTQPDVRTEPVLAPRPDDPTAPDQVACDFPGTVLYDGGRYRMWYAAARYPNGLSGSPEEQTVEWFQQNLIQGAVCYAESDDGITWHRPSLGQVMVNGSNDNNGLALVDGPCEGITLLRDDADDPERRYKMVFNDRDPRYNWTVRLATSPDGVNWKLGTERPLESFAEHSGFYKHDGLYFLNAQVTGPWSRSEGGNDRGRQGLVFVSSNFDEWLQEAGDGVILREPINPTDRGVPKPYPQVHLGTAALSLGNVVVGLYCLWDNQPRDGDWFGHGTSAGDLVLAVSHDGIVFREPVPEHPWLSRHDSLPVSAPDYMLAEPYENILCQSNGIVNAGDETRIYHSRWLNSTKPAWYWGEVALATIPRDRWGALGIPADTATGSVWTAPIELPEDGCELTLNADGAAAIRIQVADERFTLLDGFVGNGSDGTALDARIDWEGRSLRDLGGQKVRLRIELERRDGLDPRLYALDLRTGVSLRG